MTRRRLSHIVFTVTGFSFAGAGQNSGLAFIRLKDWSERPASQEPRAGHRAARHGAFSQNPRRQVFAWCRPPVPELGQSSGFDFELEDRGGLGHEGLMAARNQLLAMAAQDPQAIGVRPNGLDDTPQLHIDIDQAKATALGARPRRRQRHARARPGAALFVNDFIDRGRVKRVYVRPTRRSA